MNEQAKQPAKPILHRATLTELVYCSVATRPISEEDLSRLLASARSNNAALEVTGILLYSDATREFVQMIEGEEATLMKLFSIIASDDRHTSVDMMYRGSIESRSFDGWSMAYRSMEDIEPKILGGQTSFRTATQSVSAREGTVSRARAMFHSLSWTN
ncbi:BLUF domain-containing protein [Rhodopirellula sp. JC740]|uniref:BLUF domain-containing protein n=1 Tax=Rhodopirellula halodulae TaxID=2894198 RepID=A0ABS8NHQ9_9BACT|nr:BLUF domain-containing protein [Rhodopirellula sp. JC740]MCC9643080.1 BLUF domain-containing protein [Rhodopirellula sp. JC740]